MFAEFQNMFDNLKNKVKQQVQKQQQDYAHTPQKYQIAGKQIHEIKLLSQGAFGFIWLAEDQKTKQQFALKRVICMTEDRLRESKKQKDIMSILPKSKNVVQYFGGDILSRNGQKVVITLMQLCEGGTLFDLLQKRQNKGFTEQELVKITLQILQGLESIHSTGYYHRDVKIQNVLLGKDNSYKLCDFGSCTKEIYNFAEINKKDFDSIKEEIEGMTTPMYRPPEIVDPYLKYLVNHKADVWMTGCVLYTLAYFIHPFVDSNAIGIAAGTYKFPKYPQQTKYKVSQKINDLIRHMLTPNPSFRPSTKQLIQLLLNWNNITEISLNSEAIRRKKQELARQRELQQLNKKCVDFEGDIPIQKLMELQKKLKKTDDQQKPSTFVNKKTTQKIQNQNSYHVKVQPNNHFQKDPFSMQPNQQKPQVSTSFGFGGTDPFGSKKNIAQNPQANNNSNEVFNTKDPFGTVSGKSMPPQKKPSTMKDLWGFGQDESKSSKDIFDSKPKAQTNNNQNNFNAFASFDAFGGPSKPAQPQNSLNFQEMFAQTPVINTNYNQVPTQQVRQPSNINHANLLDF